MRQADSAPREIAWDEFSVRYAPVVRSFARRFGARPQDVDDVVQDVLLGFFLKSPSFVYDPAKGKFRGYLKVCAYRALSKRLGREAKFHGRALDAINPDEMAVEQVWNDVWEQDLLRQALELIRRTIGDTKTFRAFEHYVVFDEPAESVANKLSMHLNSVYRAKEQITRLLQEKVALLKDED